jgi:hypothetical protein
LRATRFTRRSWLLTPGLLTPRGPLRAAGAALHVRSLWWTLVTGVAALAEEGQRTDLAQRLLGTPIPSSIADLSAWQHYADALFTILRDERDLGHEWEFTDEVSRKLNDYFYANELLVQCLKVAAVSDREAVLQGLLLPPAVEKQDDKKRG